MDIKTINAFLATVELFQDLENNELDRIATHIEVNQHEPESILFSENSKRRPLDQSLMSAYSIKQKFT